MPRVVEEALPASISPKLRAYSRAVFSEFLATFIFVSAILCALVNLSRTGDAAVNAAIGTGIVVGFAGVITVFSFADISGAHFNPAITWGFLLSRKIGIIKGIAYIFAQLLGGIVAAGCVYAYYPNTLPGFPSIGDVIPAQVPSSTPAWQAFFCEVYLTFNLVYVVFATAVDRILPPDLIKVDQDFAEIRHEYKTRRVGLADGVIVAPKTPKSRDIENPTVRDNASVASYRTFNENILVFVQPGATKRNFAPIAIGLTLGFNAFLGSSSSGGAFNPARVLGAAIFSGNFNNHWLYWLGPFAGGTLASVLHTLLFARSGALLSPPRIRCTDEECTEEH